MRRYFLPILAAAALLLAGCTTPVIRSEVTAFHDWPAQPAAKSFAFTRTPAQENDLEYRAYEQLVRAELLRLGFADAPAASAALRVGLRYRVSERDVRQVEPVIVNHGWASGYYGPRWPYYRYYDPFFMDPLWYSPPVVAYQESNYRLYRRQLQIGITRAADGAKLYDVTVNSEGRTGSLAAVMPYMIRSAFADFPGKNGVPHTVELDIRDDKSGKPVRVQE